MDVYLVPVGHGRHELYCEVHDEPEPAVETETADEASPELFTDAAAREAQEEIAQ